MDYRGNKFGFRVDEENRIMRVIELNGTEWIETPDPSESERYPIPLEDYVRRYALNHHWANRRIVAWSDLLVNNPDAYARLWDKVIDRSQR